jgi:hypothetical protein
MLTAFAPIKRKNKRVMFEFCKPGRLAKQCAALLEPQIHQLFPWFSFKPAFKPWSTTFSFCAERWRGSLSCEVLSLLASHVLVSRA